MSDLIERATSLATKNRGYRFNPDRLAAIITAGLQEGQVICHINGQTITHERGAAVARINGQIVKTINLDTAELRDSMLVQAAVTGARVSTVMGSL